MLLLMARAHLTLRRNRVQLQPGQRATALEPGPAHVAQSVEHTLGKGEAMGSIPIVGSEAFRDVEETYDHFRVG